MHQETSQEFVGGQRHHFLPLFVLIVFVSESDLSIFQFFQPVIGNGDSMQGLGRDEKRSPLTYGS